MKNTIHTAKRAAAHGNITTFYLNPSDLEKWLHQNGAECVDGVEGCLQDNFLAFTRRGVAIIREHYLSAWSSDFIVEFQKAPGTDVLKNWYQFVDTVESEDA